MADLLTLQEIAARLDMPPSTVRYYRQKYKEFMPEVAAGRYSKFQLEAVEIIKDIAAATAATMQQQEIREMLSAKYALNIDKFGDGNLAATTAATAATTATTQQQQTDTALTVYERQIYGLMEIIKARDAEVKRRDELMLYLLKQLRDTEAHLEYARRPWWKKIF
jgi:DNA-binding transcriptional MerR regulator